MEVDSNIYTDVSIPELERAQRTTQIAGVIFSFRAHRIEHMNSSGICDALPYPAPGVRLDLPLGRICHSTGLLPSQHFSSDRHQDNTRHLYPSTVSIFKNSNGAVVDCRMRRRRVHIHFSVSIFGYIGQNRQPRPILTRFRY